jgi:hypothetical protein
MELVRYSIVRYSPVSHRHPRTVPAVRAEAFAHADARAASAHLVIGDRRNATDGQGGALTSRLVPHPLVRAY